MTESPQQIGWACARINRFRDGERPQLVPVGVRSAGYNTCQVISSPLRRVCPTVAMFRYTRLDPGQQGRRQVVVVRAWEQETIVGRLRIGAEVIFQRSKESGGDGHRPAACVGLRLALHRASYAILALGPGDG